MDYVEYNFRGSSFLKMNSSFRRLIHQFMGFYRLEERCNSSQPWKTLKGPNEETNLTHEKLWIRSSGCCHTWSKTKMYHFHDPILQVVNSSSSWLDCEELRCRFSWLLSRSRSTDTPMNFEWSAGKTQKKQGARVVLIHNELFTRRN